VTKKSAPAVAVEERTLPSNLEAETSILGAILVHNDTFDTAAGLVKPEHFFRVAHQRIFTAMATLRQQKTAIDLVTLKNELGRVGDLNEVGGPAYISSLASGVPRSTNLKFYASIVVEKAHLRDLIMAANKMLTAAYEAEEPASVIVSEADRALLALQGRGGHSESRALSDTASTRFKTMEWRVEHCGQLRGIDTGYKSINDLTSGLRPGNLDIIAARPSVGKSTLSLNIGVHAACAGHRVMVFSLEMTGEELQDRIMSQLSKVPLSRIQEGHIGQAEWAPLSQAIETMNTLPIVINDRSGLTAADMRAECRRQVAEYGSLALVIVDYIQLMRGEGSRKGATRTEELSDAAMRLKDLAKELSVPVILVSQLRRLEGRPKIEDLRECGALEQVADSVGLLYRKDHRVSGTTEFILAKQRNGPTGTCLLTIDRDITTFVDGGEPEPEPSAEEKKAATRRGRQRTFANRAMGHA